MSCERVAQDGRQIGSGLEKPAAWQLATHATDPCVQLVALVAALSEQDFCLLEEWLRCLPVLQPCQPIAIREQPFGVVGLPGRGMPEYKHDGANCEDLNTYSFHRHIASKDRNNPSR